MPALPVISGAYLAVTENQFEGLRMGNTLGFRSNTPPADGPTDLATAQAIRNSLVTNLPDLYHDTCQNTLTGGTVKVYPLGHPLLAATEGVYTATGGIAGAICPVSTALVIKHAVDRRGRGSQSRTFLGPVSVNWLHSDGKSIEPTNATIVQDAWDAFILAVQTDLAAVSGGVVFCQISSTPVDATYTVIESIAEAELTTARGRVRRL